ncbi:MAG: hypothetical protein H6695_01275 [Deferribacteres bacterium]|nr:hypothetical protein [candidate division KSB1 bacterium]MCB9508779.1 hypothetical protein [Deferribacteres bacterium]
MQKQFQAVFALAGIAIAIVGLTNDQIPLLIVGFSLIFLAALGRFFLQKDK